MKLLTGALIAALAIVGGGARTQDPPAVHLGKMKDTAKEDK